MKNEFKIISIRGRLAFGLIFFEELLKKYNVELLTNKFLNDFVEKLWEVCSGSNLESIEEFVNEVAPYSILDDSPNNDFNEYDFLSFEEANDLRRFYLTLPQDIVSAMNFLTEIAFGNLYGNTGSYSSITYNGLVNLLAIYKHNGISFKDSELKVKSSFEELNGWGDPRPKDIWKEMCEM
ncbi:hypothetical protein [Flavobacterium sp.]|uniref:hypothetical protein n=1 Tax=Flavobacterium sp. TaxID=239 RepID=UPI002601A21C|nr:hypothetical protein [Flavobacterium sp.]